MAVRSPTAQHNPENAKRADAHDKQNSDVEILRNLKRRAEGQTSYREQRRSHGKHRRQPKHQLVRVIRNNVFLDEQLQRVRDGLQQSMWTHAHRPQPRLHVRHQFALDQYDVANDQRQDRDDDYPAEQRRPVELQEIQRRLGRGLHQRSTSPSTMSIVPIIATTSATRCPRTMRSNACKLMNDGGRIRTRYGCTVPSLTT